MKRIICLVLTVMIAAGMFVLPASAISEYRTWLQSDSRWGSIEFGERGDTISKSGCAITSIAKLLVHSGAVSSDPAVFNPGIYCNWLKNNGGITSQGWIVWSVAANYSSKFSYYGAVALAGTQSQKTATIKSYVDDGYVVVVAVKNSGHYVAVDKVVGSTVYIMDPANTGYTNLFNYAAGGVEKIQIYKGPHNGSGSSVSYDTTVDPVGAGSYKITSDNGINLRKGAGTSYDVLTAIPYNTTVQVTKVQNGWGYTVYNGHSGWFTLEFAQLLANSVRGVQIKAPTKLTYTVGDKLDTAGMTVTALYTDGTSKVLSSGYTVNGFSSEKPGSYKVYVTYQNKSAVFTVTVEKKQVVYTTGTYAVNSSDGVNLRAESNTDSEILTAIPDKVRLEITEIKENWGKTVYGEHTGWICLDYATLTTAIQTGIKAVAKAPCILVGSSIKAEDFAVSRVYEDNSTSPITDFLLTLGTIKENILPVTIADGDFSVTVELKLFESIPMGDCNFDGLVNAGDALAVLKHAVGKEAVPFYTEVADVTADVKINASDALMILQVAVGKRPPFEQTEETK